MANVVLKLNGNYTKQNIRDSLSFRDKSSPSAFLKSLASLDGSSNLELQLLNDDAVAASATVTFSDVATADDTVLVNGTTFIGKASPAVNNEFAIGASATASALGLANAINASTTAAVNTFVKASPAAGVCTVSAKNAGVAGNTITLAEGVDTGTVISVSAARLGSGTDETSTSVSYKSW
jgi:phage tail sheath gpL-like